MPFRYITYTFLLIIGLFLCSCSLLPSGAQQANPAAPRPTVGQQAVTRTPARRATATPPSTRATAVATAGAAQSQVQPIPGFDVVTPDQLPPEARDTLALIASDGPFPYRQDGATFQNRERLLPNRPRGYYREYTVETPGEDDRGARRIVAGEGGEIFYTEDHYDSFVQVLPQ